MAADDIICACMGVTREAIEEAVKGGAKTFDDVQDKTDAGLGCGSCEEEVQEVIDEVLAK
jgi:NAD(P)H-nitrite reductase large subunit